MLRNKEKIARDLSILLPSSRAITFRPAPPSTSFSSHDQFASCHIHPGKLFFCTGTMVHGPAVLFYTPYYFQSILLRAGKNHILLYSSSRIQVDCNPSSGHSSPSFRVFSNRSRLNCFTACSSGTRSPCAQSAPAYCCCSQRLPTQRRMMLYFFFKSDASYLTSIQSFLIPISCDNVKLVDGKFPLKLLHDRQFAPSRLRAVAVCVL